MATGIGLLADRPAFGNVTDLYYGLDTGLLYEDTGTAWIVDANIATHRKVLAETVLRLAASAAALYNDDEVMPFSSELAAIVAAAVTNGFLKRTGTNAWTIDTSTYLTGNQTITISGDGSGSGATAITLTITSVGGSSASDIHDAELLANAATNLPTPNTIAKRDASGNARFNNAPQEYLLVNSSGGTTVLTAASPYNIRVGGSASHTVKLPDATTLTNGHSYMIKNGSSGDLTIIRDDGTTLTTLLGSQELLIMVFDNSLPSTNAWSQILGSAISQRLTNKQLDARSRFGVTSTATAGGTTTLLTTSTPIQIFTGTLNETVVLTSGSGQSIGTFFIIRNDSTGTLTIQNATPTTILTLLPNQWALLISNATSTAADWKIYGSAQTETLTNKTIAPAQVLGAVAEDTAPVETEDYVYTYDTSALDYKKVLLGRLRAMRLSNDNVSATPTAMEFALAFPNAIAGQSFHLTDNSVGTDYLVVYKGSAQWTYVAMSVATYVAFKAYMAALTDSIFWPCDETSGIYLSPDHEAKAEGRELFINGAFTSTLSPSSGTNWSWVSGVARHTTGSVVALVQTLVTTAGRLYKGVFTVLNRTAGTVSASNYGSSVSSNATFTYYFVATGTSYSFTPSSDFDGDLDNVSVKEVGILPSSAFPSLELLRDTAFLYFNAAWPVATNWTLAGAGAVHTAGSTTALTQTAPIIIGRTYTCVVTVANYVAGSITPRAGSTGTGGSAISANGVAASQTLTCAGSSAFALVPSSDFDGTIVNVSLEPADGLIAQDGGFETWTSATNLTYWTETLAGTSTVNQETVVTHGGGNAVRLDGDASANNAQISQGILKIGSTYLVKFWARDSDNSGVVLRVRGSTTIAVDQALTSTYTQYSAVFTTDSVSIVFQRGSASFANKSIYIDDVEIIEIDPLSLKVSGATINQSSGNALIDPLVGFDGVSDGLFPASIGVLNSYVDPTAGHAVSVAYSHTSGVSHTLFRYRANSTNYLFVLVDANGDLVAEYMAGGTAATMTLTPGLTGGSHMLTVIVDITGDLLTLINDGDVVGSIGSLGIWAGNFDATVTAFGVSNTSFANVWNGLLGHFLWQNDVITTAEAIARHQLAGCA